MKKEIFILLFVYVICILFAGIFWTNPNLLLVIYILISALMIKKWHSKKDLIYFFVAFILGPVGELFATRLGAWSYAKPFFYIPLWLPFLWGIASLFMMKLPEALTKIKMN
jgi:uncharacterized membrane protein YoaT (DUF817 family)